MIQAPMDILQQHPIRKSKKQKSGFLSAVSRYAESQGYVVKIEMGSFGCRNLVIGNTETADYLVTAHYDTPASIGLPNFITPCNLVTFILFQLLILVPFFTAAFVAGFLTSLVTENEMLWFYAAYAAYFGMLFLMMFGPANRHNANDNTSGVITVLEILTALPEKLRSKVCFVLFDLEEAGLRGSSSYRKAHKQATDRQMVLNLDCVGDGNHILLFPNTRLKKHGDKMNRLSALETNGAEKHISVRRKGFAYCPSDHRHFPFGVGIMAFHRTKIIGFYCDRIHTWRDTVLDYVNVRLLRDRLIAFLSES